MSKKRELEKTIDVVERILTKIPATRDSDEYLFCFTINQLGVDYETPFREVMQRISNKELPALESIRRCRQKLQEQKPELRGKNYVARQVIAEPEVKEFIKEQNNLGEEE